ncbi:cytochrome c1 [Pseudomonas syringae]|nr:cytochrome c1 [Pseudomonas syringae]MBD8790016.1 cytochrome c1 [Pseudomonas syringae]MBD8799991.1 cytochrome c1 [Pseudomonas syringae]MBD8811013.1 cytochrome c1 [Pseudomonas syringae]
MSRLWRVWVLALMPLLALAAEPRTQGLEPVRIDVSDQAALQDGARTFVNYCLGCHGAQYQRYERVADDLGIGHEVMLDTLVFTGVRIGDHMKSSMRPADAKAWFGVEPPDLTLVARVRGTDWLYHYLRSFYQDPTRPTGVNNRVFPNVGMPNVLEHLQGRQVLSCQAPEAGPSRQAAPAGAGCDQLTLVAGTGRLSAEQFDDMIRHLVTFLAYSAEPLKLEHRRIGTWVLLYLAVFIILAWLLKREYWKDIH